MTLIFCFLNLMKKNTLIPCLLDLLKKITLISCFLDLNWIYLREFPSICTGHLVFFFFNLFFYVFSTYLLCLYTSSSFFFFFDLMALLSIYRLIQFTSIYFIKRHFRKIIWKLLKIPLIRKNIKARTMKCIWTRFF